MLRTRISIASGSRYCVSMMPTERPDEAPATWPRSMTVTSVAPRRVRCHAVARPRAPAPTMTTEGALLIERSGLFPDHGPEQAHHDEEAAEQGDQAEGTVRRVRARMGDELEADPEHDRP